MNVLKWEMKSTERKCQILFGYDWPVLFQMHSYLINAGYTTEALPINVFNVKYKKIHVTAHTFEKYARSKIG